MSLSKKYQVVYVISRSTSSESGEMIGTFQLPEDRVIHQTLEVVPIADLSG